MRRGLVASAALAGLVLALPAVRANEPQLGGAMKHIFVTLYAPTKTLYHAIQDGADERVHLLNYGDTYAGAAAVLDGTHYSARYGWLADGNWNVPAGRGIFVRLLDQTPGLRVYGQNDYAPILGTGGSSVTWLWDTTMVHNWYAVDACGWYEAHYRVYVGFSDGSADPAYTPTHVRLVWQFVWNVAETPGDQDGDGDLDLRDFAELQTCSWADADASPGRCGCFDADLDLAVERDDAAAFLNALDGPV